jgi:hypothetical protein
MEWDLDDLRVLAADKLKQARQDRHKLTRGVLKDELTAAGEFLRRLAEGIDDRVALGEEEILAMVAEVWGEKE